MAKHHIFAAAATALIAITPAELRAQAAQYDSAGTDRDKITVEYIVQPTLKDVPADIKDTSTSTSEARITYTVNVLGFAHTVCPTVTQIPSALQMNALKGIQNLVSSKFAEGTMWGKTFIVCKQDIEAREAYTTGAQKLQLKLGELQDEVTKACSNNKLRKPISLGHSDRLDNTACNDAIAASKKLGADLAKTWDNYTAQLLDNLDEQFPGGAPVRLTITLSLTNNLPPRSELAPKQ